MAIKSGVVARVSTNYGKFSVVLEGDPTWYGTKQEWNKCDCVVGDTIEFDDGGKNYFKNARITGKASGPVSAGSHAPKSGGKTWNNVGVEVGHASNIATQMALKHFDQNMIGSKEYYKFFLEQTRLVYKVVGQLRKEAEDGAFDAPVEAASAAPVAPEDDIVVMKAEPELPPVNEELADIFGT